MRNFKSYVDERVSEFKKKVMTSDEEFNIPASLVKKICSNLPNNKTCGLDGIFYEHIKYCGSYFFFSLARLFSLIIKKNCIPSQWHQKLSIQFGTQGHCSNCQKSGFLLKSG